MSALVSKNKLCKHPNESRLYSMNFSANLGSTEKLTGTPTATSKQIGGGTSTLTISSVAVSSDGKSVNFRIADGTKNKSYEVQIECATDSSNTLVGQGILEVKDN